MTLIRRIASTAIGAALVGTALVAVQTPAQGATVLMTAFEHSNFGGASIFMVRLTNGYTCTNSLNDVESSTAALGNFNDRISSYTTINNCTARLWRNADRTGQMLNYTGRNVDISSIPAMNDAISAIDVS